MALENLVTQDPGALTIASSVSSGASTITLGGAFAALPTENFRLRLASNSAHEIVLVTSRSGATCTVTRAQEGTSAASWTTSDAVTPVFTAAGLAAWSPTNLTGSARFTTAFLNPSTENVYFDIGVSLAIPEAGKYLVTYGARCAGDPGGPDHLWEFRLFDVGAGAAVAGSYAPGSQITSGKGCIGYQLSMLLVFTATGSTTLKLQGKLIGATADLGACAVFGSGSADSYTGINFVRLSR